MAMTLLLLLLLLLKFGIIQPLPLPITAAAPRIDLFDESPLISFSEILFCS